MTTKQIQEKRAQEYNIMRDLKERAGKENRLMTDDEKRQFDEASATFDKLTEEMQRLERLENLEAEYRNRDDERRATASANANPKAQEDAARAEYEKRFWEYLQGGDDLTPAEARKLTAQFRGTNVIAGEATTTYGAYLIPETFWAELERTMKQFGGMLQASRVINSERGGTMNYPTNDDTSATGAWLSEPRASALTVEDTTFSRKQYSAYTWGTLAKVSLEIIQDESVGLFRGILAEILGERAGRALNLAFTLGNGSGKPTGILNGSNGASTGKTTSSASAITKAEILDLLHSVDPAYRTGPNVAFMMHDSTVNAIRQLDASTNVAPIWIPSFQVGVPDKIAGYNYVINQNFPTIAASQKVIAFGDWSKYIIRQVQTPSMVALNERYMDELHRGYVMWARYDGKLLNSSAIKLLTMHA